MMNESGTHGIFATVAVLGLAGALTASAQVSGDMAWTFDGTLGSNVPDATGNGNDGTLNGDATTSTNTPFVYGGNLSLSLDGSGDFVEVIGPNTFSPDATVSGWINPSSLDAENWLWRFNRSISAGSGYYAARLVNSDGTLQAFYGNQTGAAVASAMLSLNTWTHIAVTYEESVGVQIYINGSASGAAASWTGVGTIGDMQDSVIGAENNGGGNPFAGLMDEIRIVAGIRDASNILEDVNNSIVPAAIEVSFDEIALQDTIALSFTSEVGRIYRLESAPTPTNMFDDLGVILEGDGTVKNMFDPTEATGTSTSKTYRILAQ